MVPANGQKFRTETAPRPKAVGNAGPKQRPASKRCGRQWIELTAWDCQVNGGGGVDKFRIKIWSGNPSNVVYDNMMGAADGAVPTTVLGGGSIVIHK